MGASTVDVDHKGWVSGGDSQRKLGNESDSWPLLLLFVVVRGLASVGSHRNSPASLVVS